MKIKKILSRNRRDFTAIFECEHCECTEQSTGYDDKYFHEEVIPNMKCTKCEKMSPKDYRPLTTKYKENEIV